jgi:transcriptional regulator GlxA family with amidase domain
VAVIVVFAPRDAVASSVAVAKDVLAQASRIAAATTGREPDPVLIATIDGGPAECAGDVTISADTTLADVQACDLVWVAAYWTHLYEGAERNAEALPWLLARREEGALVAANGPATFLLAEAGLLDGRTATIYSPQAEAFRRRHPRVNLQLDRPITDAGGVFCCVGMNSTNDLLVHLVERLYGREVAAAIADWALVDSQRSYQRALAAFDGQKYHGDNEILSIQAWLEGNYSRPVTMARVASVFGMSPRTLTRRFTAATGEAPSEYLARLRVEIAKDLLHDVHLSIAEVAARVGYRDVGSFYDTFRRHAGSPPHAYRRAPR